MGGGGSNYFFTKKMHRFLWLISMGSGGGKNKLPSCENFLLLTEVDNLVYVTFTNWAFLITPSLNGKWLRV